MLYLVATPIGNLGDITRRAVEILGEVDLIASEDTRKTGGMLKRLEITTRQMALHEHNERNVASRVVAMLREGKDVALVTDAGTPGISDPGFCLIREVLAADLELTMVPGPSAFVMALVLSGLPVHGFTFRGFPPRKRGARQRFLAIDAESPHTLIFYESPFRVVSLLQDALAVYGDRPAAVAAELTKKFERVQRGLLSELIAAFADRKPRGEYCVVIGGKPSRRSGDDGDGDTD